MADDLMILHNPRCSTSRSAVAACETLDVGVPATIRNYLTDPLTEAEWLDVLGKLEDPATDLVRRDNNFNDSGLSDADVQTAEQVAAVLADRPILAQRPVLIRGDRAIIGRPKDRIEQFLAG